MEFGLLKQLATINGLIAGLSLNSALRLITYTDPIITPGKATIPPGHVEGEAAHEYRIDSGAVSKDNPDDKSASTVSEQDEVTTPITLETLQTAPKLHQN